MHATLLQWSYRGLKSVKTNSPSRHASYHVVGCQSGYDLSSFFLFRHSPANVALYYSSLGPLVCTLGEFRFTMIGLINIEGLVE